MKHHIERTSVYGPGQPFIGTCRLCGMTGLKASAALDDCENVRGLSTEDALIETVMGEPSPQATAEGEHGQPVKYVLSPHHLPTNPGEAQ